MDKFESGKSTKPIIVERRSLALPVIEAASADNLVTQLQMDKV
jgi:hypothetical protein